MHCFFRFAGSILLRGAGVGANGCWWFGSAVLIDFGLSKKSEEDTFRTKSAGIEIIEIELPGPETCKLIHFDRPNIRCVSSWTGLEVDQTSI